MTSFLGLVLLLPLFCIIGVIIKTSGRGPVFFRQQRVGKGGTNFQIYKFRTMSVINSARESLFNPGDLSRITPIGAVLRKNKIDELPQLFNVLAGKMSIVGPRPETREWVDAFPERWRRIHSVKPGITDNASLIFFSEEAILSQSENPIKTYRDNILPVKLDLYDDYLDNYSFLNDLKIIIKTIVKIVK